MACEVPLTSCSHAGCWRSLLLLRHILRGQGFLGLGPLHHCSDPVRTVPREWKMSGEPLYNCLRETAHSFLWLSCEVCRLAGMQSIDNGNNFFMVPSTGSPLARTIFMMFGSLWYASNFSTRFKRVHYNCATATCRGILFVPDGLAQIER